MLFGFSVIVVDLKIIGLGAFDGPHSVHASAFFKCTYSVLYSDFGPSWFALHRKHRYISLMSKASLVRMP